MCLKEDTPAAVSISSARILVSNTIPPLKELYSSGKCLIPQLGQDRYKISPGYFVIPESKESAQDTGASLKETPLVKSGQAGHQNIKYSNKLQTTEKIWILESTLIIYNKQRKGRRGSCSQEKVKD